MKSAPRVIGELAASRKGKAGFETRLRSILDGHGDLALTEDEKKELERGGYGDLKDLTEEYSRYVEAKEEYDKARPTTTDASRMIEGGDGQAELPYNRFVDLMTDNSVSEAARAKMYYYLTGRVLPMSTVMGSSVTEENGGYTVQSIGANGVITSRSFGDKKRADVEVNRINRQAELNGFDVGERYYDWQGDNKRMYEACESVAEETGAPANLLFDLMKRKTEAMNEVELEWAEKILDAYNGLGDKYGTSEVRTAINEEFGVDVDKAIRKEPGRRSEQEQKAAREYANRLFADVKRKQEEAAERGEAPASPDAPTSNSQIAALLGIDDGEQGDPVNAAFNRGHEADVQERQDIAIELSDPNNAEAQEAWNGVVQRINEDAAYMVAQLTEHPVQQGYRGGLAVGAGDANKLQLLRRVTIPVGGHHAKRHAAVLHLDVGYTVRQFLRQFLTHHCHGTFLHRTGYVAVAVDLCAALRHKQGSCTDLARVKLDVFDIHRHRAVHLGINPFYYIL